MTVEGTVSGLEERVVGRAWMVRLDPADRRCAAVRVSCGRPACAPQVLPSAAVGRTAAVAHLATHLRAAPGPRPEASCACRAAECHTHVRADGPRDRAPALRCGGPVVLAVVNDRQGRWWQALECCARCAAAHPSAKIVATAPAAGRAPAAGARGAAGPPPAPVGPHFSHASSSPAPVPRAVPAPRPRPRRNRRTGKIAQRFVPYDLHPVALRDELIELGDLFRAYQQRPEPDLEQLADLHARKAKAFHTWAEVTGETELRLDARRAEQAAAAALLQHQQRTGQSPVGEGEVTNRLLPGLTQWDHARTVLAHVAEHTPLPGPEARLMAVMLTLRSALTGIGNLVGQDVKGLPLTEPEELIGRLVDSGWLSIPGTADDLLASRPESPTPITIPSLMPDDDGRGPFDFGRKTRPKLSGWAQRVVGDKKLRKKKTGAATRLLALALAVRTTTDGRLGPEGEGIDLAILTSWCAVEPDELEPLVEQLTAADWLEEAAVTGGRLTGRLAERVLQVSCPLP
ncbi:hypothetical protein J7F02_21155 [Streptomyces sp. ISL-112]|uniref:hypothetical protein n=1 Tax=unclassified Streptomyces TaxID=2593676 RepID=UPI001BE687A5|nr:MULTISPECIES: hypothetical protein [unclassified Streptomyces]MBT2428093.1 hypothetical protein [Streptomyces sp. ISL-112]MBT2463112.1 hypothetical protein [Streptomyces sp. ISL-63]